jgi:two-component system OmpR family response regulator
VEGDLHPPLPLMKILIVEDDPQALALIRFALTEDGHAVDAAMTGDEGLLLARINPYDAIVLDLVLPDSNGIEIVAQLRSEQRSVPVLMLTATDAVAMKVKGLDAGADDYLTKPFDPGELRARLRALTRRGTTVRGEEVAVGPLVLDRPAREVRLAGERLAITPKEHALLEYFMLHPDQVVSRTDLLENAWDMNFDPVSNVIDAHIARLRAKLRAHPEAPQLETVRGAGFRLTVRTPPGA